MTTQIRPDGGPTFIYGTAWKEDQTRKLTKLALETGFRAVDTANQRKHYVEAAVGDALQEAIDKGIVERHQVFIQTKFTYQRGQDHRLPYDASASYPRQVEQSLESSREHLGVDVIDSYLLHGPSTRVGLGEADHQVWEKMEQLQRSGQVRAIGVSNVSAEQLELLVEQADIAPAFVQNRCFARAGWDRQVRRICDANDIGYQGFSLLTANTRELKTDRITAMARRYDKTVPQLVFRFALQVGMFPLTGTTDRRHMRQDLAVTEFELADEDLEAIETIAVR